MKFYNRVFHVDFQIYVFSQWFLSWSDYHNLAILYHIIHDWCRDEKSWNCCRYSRSSTFKSGKKIMNIKLLKISFKIDDFSCFFHVVPICSIFERNWDQFSNENVSRWEKHRSSLLKMHKRITRLSILCILQKFH